ncbi:MAG: hypothetical protein EXS22_01615 [Pedosphaera sp.]|nr:hypothetical protein [Pedosphaera sp.]MSU42724.1 hypothetical protein [Pedosphaera sp.]
MKPILCALLLVTASLFAQDKPGNFVVSGLTFAKPAGWKALESKSEMRKAQLEVPAAKGAEPGECIFFYFGPDGAGGVQANVGRWLQQFAKEPAVKHGQKQVTINDVKMTLVEAEGTYLSGQPGGEKVPKANYMLLGAIVEAKEGSIYVRLTGPAATVRGANKDFIAMLEKALK